MGPAAQAATEEAAAEAIVLASMEAAPEEDAAAEDTAAARFVLESAVNAVAELSEATVSEVEGAAEVVQTLPPYCDAGPMLGYQSNEDAQERD